MGKSRAAAFALGIQDIDESVHVNTFSETVDSREIDSSEASHPESNSSYFFVLIEVLLTFHSQSCIASFIYVPSLSYIQKYQFN